MHYDAITHTRKAIRNLQSQVRLFLRKQNQETLPQINRKSNMRAYRQTPLTLRNSRQRSLFQSPGSMETHNPKQQHTISFNEIETDQVDVTILKPRSPHKIKIMLPKFQRRVRNRVQSQSEKHSVQLIEHSLLQDTIGTIGLKFNQKQDIYENKYSLKLKKPNRVPKIPRYNNKVSLKMKQETKKIPEPDNMSEPKRQECYSPWQMQEDSGLIQMSTIYQHS